MARETLERVAVVASAQTRFREAWSTMQHVDLISQVVDDALRGSGLRIQDVGAVINCGSDVLDGRSISNCGFLGAMGAHHKEESRVEEDGLFGAVYGAMKVLSGAAPVALVIAYSKPSESDITGYYSTLAEPFYQRPIGVDHLVAAGLMANQYATVTEAKREVFIDIAAQAWRNATANPWIETGNAPTADDIRAAEVVADPLTRYEIARPVDGAVAVVLATEPVARRVTSTPVWITGMGSAMDSQFLAERTPGELAACAAAAKTAIGRSGIKNRSAFDLAEVSGGSAAGEAMVVEALGLAPKGGAVDLYGDGSIVNPSGGAIPADPVMATGLVRLHEAAGRLGGWLAEGHAGTGMVSKALVHGAGGLGLQNHCVFVLEV